MAEWDCTASSGLHVDGLYECVVKCHEVPPSYVFHGAANMPHTTTLV